MALDDFSKGYYEKRRAMMGRAPVQDSGDVMRKVNKQVYQAERSRPVLEQAAAEMQTEGRERSIGERIGKTISGAAKSYLSSLTNAGGDAARTQGGLWRDFTRDSVREWQQEIDRWERDLSAWRADGSLTREEEEDLTGMIQANREKIATYTMAQGGRRGSAEAARGLADQIALSGARDTDQAKEGIGAAGQFAVDAGTALAQMAGDIALGAVSGGSAMIPMAARSYGGSSQKARLEGASDDRAALYGLASAALETGTELLGNVGRISSKFFGGGAVDDVVEGMVRALERKGGGKVSRALLNRAGTAAAGFVTEGAEEALSAIIDPFLRRAIYSDDPLDAGEILGDALYDFAVGGAVGGIAGGIGGTDTTRGLRSAERNADAAIDRAYDAMGSAGPWSPAAAEAVREANGLLEQAAWAAAETDGISGKAADRILRDESALERLRQETGLELSDNMTQSERRAAVKQAANWLAVLQKEQGQAGVRAVEGKRESVREERRADGDIGPYGVENRTAGGEKQTAAKRAYDTKRVRDGARAFGESGAKALAAAYDGRTDAESYYGGFAAYYQAGISNMDMRKVRSEYGAQLSEAQKYAAYVAGQNDAILSIQRERQAAPYAKSAGSDSGLVYDDFVRQAVESGRAIEDVNGETRSYLTAETAAKINSVAKSLGVRVQFVDSVRGGTANAQISGSTVLVERNNPNPVMAVVGHEMTHRMQELAPAEYREFRDIIAQEEQSSIQRRVDAYAAQGVALTYEQAMDEVAADYAGRMIDDGKVLDRFIEAHKENRTLLEKVRDAIQAIVRKLTGAEKKQAQTAEGKLTAALEAAAKRTETLQGESSDGTMGATRNSLKDLTEGERSALLQYKSSESYKINAKLRDGISLTEAERKMVDELDHALEKLPRVEGTVYRTLNFDDVFAPQEEYEAFIVQHAEGVFARYKAYTSVSTKTDGYPLADGTQYGVTLEIASRNARDLAGLGNNFESEALFPRRSVFDITRVTTDKNGHTRIYMEEVQINGGDQHQGHDTQKRGVAVRDLQEAHSAHTDLYGVSEADTGGNYGRRENLQGEGEEVERYSLKAGTENKSAAALQEENELLRERVEYWKGQTRRTKRVTTDKKAVQKAARELIRSYGADLDAGDITQDIQSLYDYVASGYDGKDELTYTEARRRAEAIAEKLVGNAVAVDETYEQYSDLRAYLRSTTLSLSEEDSRDIPDYGDWRKHQMGRMVIRKGHTNIDQVYQEMSEMWPEFFDEQRENNPVDQLLRIAEVMDGIYNVEEYNPFDPYMQQAITGAANEIMERFFDLPQTRATFADRQARKLDDAKAKGRERVQKVREQNAARLAELRRQNRERTEKAVERERTRRSEQIGKLKQRYREKDAAGRERRSARELRAKIMRHASALSQKLLRPSDKQHIPESLRQAVAAMLESINLESAYTTDPNTGKRVKDSSGTPTKRTEAFRALRLAYAEITKDGGDYTLIIDPDLMDNLNELESMKNTPIADMGMDQLATVWATLKAVEASIRTANKMLGASRFETISGFADGIRSDNILRQDRGDYRGIAGKVDRLVNLDMLTPQGYFHRLGKTGEELFRMMRAAQDRHITIMQQAQDKTAEIIGKTDVNKLEREKHTFELSGGKVTMSTAQIMGLYELMKRKQAQDHILKGGIRPDTISSGRGLREDRRSDPVKVSMDDLATITGTLTEEQIRIADGLQKFMGGNLAELGNEASMAVYGYRKFTEKDYYPIKVDKNQTKRDISKEAQVATIAGRGFTKSVTPKANNAVMLESIFDTYSSHVNDMATYAAWLPTMENIRRIRDFTFRDSEGNRTGDVKSIIERVFGKNGNAYLNKLVDDINQGVRPNGTGNFTDALVGNYKAAAVAANIRVVLQQPTAILRAMSSLDPKYLLAGTVKRGDWAKVKKYAPIAVWKDWGYFDINTGRQMKDVLLSSDSVMEKVKQAAMAGAGKADSFAWARLWNAVEAETRDKRPGLKPGTEAFYQAVSTRFSEVVDQTQVVDGLLQRSQIMRSPDALTKMATSFMAEPTKTYNMFVNAVYDLRHATGKDGRSNAKRALARTSAALVVSFAVNAVMQSIVDALRDDDKERDYWEKFLTAYTGFTGEEETALDYWNSFWDGNLEANFNPAGYIPYFKDLVSIMQGYDVSRMDMEPVSKVLEAAANMKKALSGEGKYSVAGASANLLAEVSRLLGIPVANLKRDIQAGITTAAIETDNYLMQYRIDKALLNMGYQGNTKNFYDILYNASINDREAYETIYADMVASGMPEDKIRNAMESRMKRDQGVESVGDLEQRYLSPSQERRYNSTRNSMAGSSVWTAASRDQQEAAEKDLYDLTVGNDSGEKLQEKIAAGAAYGISEADYLLYRLALHVADQPTENGNLGSYTGEEVQTAIDMLPGLDDEARAYLWEAAGKSEKSNPYK